MLSVVTAGPAENAGLVMNTSLASNAESGFKVERVATPREDVSAPANVRWQNFDQGLRDAAKSGKYAFIDVYTDWCTYCKKMDLTTYKHRAVVSALDKRFVSIKFNAESNDLVSWKGNKFSQAELAAQWGVEGFPTLLFLNSKGEIIGNFPSFADSDLMLKLLGYISSGAREKKVPFEEYLKKEAS